MKEKAKELIKSVKLIDQDVKHNIKKTEFASSDLMIQFSIISYSLTNCYELNIKKSEYVTYFELFQSLGTFLKEVVNSFGRNA